MACLFTKIFGERNTGATYLSKLINKNFATDNLRGDFGVDKRVMRLIMQQYRSKEREFHNNRVQDEYHERILYSDFGWKHAAPPIDIIRAAPHSKDTLFLLITKHPVHFLTSLHVRPQNPLLEDDDDSFDKFLSTPWPTSVRDNLNGETLENPIELWNKKMRVYLDVMKASENVIHLRYEDILSDFEESMDKIAEYIPKITNGYGNVKRSIVAKDNMRFEDYQRRYKYHKIKNDHKKRDLEFIYRKIDSDVMDELGYRTIL